MYLNSKDYTNYYCIDIETESLTPQTIWCAVIRNLGTDQVWRFKNDGSANIYHELKRFIDERPSAIWVGHNSISFDIPVINRLCGTNISLDRVVDTLCLSYLYWPSIPDGHSLDAYGIRLKFPKIEFSDWSKFSDEMLTYCERDVDLTVKIYWALRERMNKIGFSELSCEIEHKTRVIIDKQERNGFYFNSAGAHDLQSKLENRLSDLSQDVHKLFPAKLEEVGRYIRRRKKDGSDYASYERHLQEYDEIRDNDDGTYSCYDYTDFNIASPKQRLSRLTDLGFQPTVFTKKGSPKLDEDSLLAFSEASGRPEVAAMANWLVVRGRLNMLVGNPETGSKGWLDYVGPDNRIHGKVLSCGAGSRRMVHSQPNTANIPSAAKAQYGHECRALWTVEPGLDRVLVGYDAAGLETVGLLHLLNNSKATEILLRPKPDDVHTSNSRVLSELLGRPIDREWGAKTCVPLDTQALSRNGWKYWYELKPGEEILGYNPKTKQKEWTKLLDINVCKDEVFEISNSHRTFRANGAHRWFVKQRGTGKRPLKQHYFSDEVRTTNELTTESSIIVNAPFNELQDRIPCAVPEWVKDEKYGINWTQRVLDMSHSQRKQFLQGFLLADGHIAEGDHWCWGQNQGEISDALILCSYLVNDGQIHIRHRTNPNGRVMDIVTLAKKSHLTMSKMKKKSLGEQEVWCPKTELGSWVMKQGDEITITGNTWYAWLYGAYPPKLGSIVKGPPSDGELIIKTFFKNVPGLEKLIKEVHYEWKSNKGLLKCVDGGYVRCPSQGAALNYKIQPLGAVVMKLAMILLDEELERIGLWHMKVGDIHDEGQHETDHKSAQKLGETAVQAIRNAGESLNLNVKTDGDYKIGENWSLTH